jgi:hypothetical protein
MNKHRVIWSLLSLVFVLGALTPQFAQDVPTDRGKSDGEAYNHALILGLLRTINTAEVTDLSKYGSYSSWQTLLAHQRDFLDGWLSREYSQQGKVHFGALPEIVPGWTLRLNVHPDGHGYDALFEDKTDKNGYAALSDERGVIRECWWLH